MENFPQLNGFKSYPGFIRLIGHRGARGLVPENTIEGFEFTLNLGVMALEFDVLFSKDNVPVITHDNYLSAAATRDNTGKWLEKDGPNINELTLSELKEFDVGGLDESSLYGQRYPEQKFLSKVRIPTLSELLKFACLPKNLNLYLLLEIKSEPSLDSTNAVRRVIDEVRDKKLVNRTVLHSFDWELLKECQKVAPEIPCSFLSELPGKADKSLDESPEGFTPDFSSFEVSIPKAVANRNGQMWCPDSKDVTLELVQEAHDLGLLVCPWTVNEIKDFENMVSAGVDGIITDYPDRAQNVLNAFGMNW